MITLRVDSRRRVVLPEVKPGQVYAFENAGNGKLVLTVLAPAEPAPPTCKLVKDKHGILVLDNGRVVTREEVRQALAMN